MRGGAKARNDREVGGCWQGGGKLSRASLETPSANESLSAALDGEVRNLAALPETQMYFVLTNHLDEILMSLSLSLVFLPQPSRWQRDVVSGPQSVAVTQALVEVRLGFGRLMGWEKFLSIWI